MSPQPLYAEAHGKLVMRGDLSEHDLIALLQIVSVSRRFTAVYLTTRDRAHHATLYLKSMQVVAIELMDVPVEDGFSRLLDYPFHFFRVVRLPSPEAYPQPLGPLGKLLLSMTAVPDPGAEHVAEVALAPDANGHALARPTVPPSPPTTLGAPSAETAASSASAQTLDVPQAGPTASPQRGDAPHAAPAPAAEASSPSPSAPAPSEAPDASAPAAAGETGDMRAIASVGRVPAPIDQRARIGLETVPPPAALPGVAAPMPDASPSRRPAARALASGGESGGTRSSAPPPSLQASAAARDDLSGGRFLLETRRPAALAPRIAFVSPKGGVGKTTLALHLGVALARRGKRVLLVDADPSNGVLHALAAKPRLAGAFDLLDDPAAAPSAVIRTALDGLTALPATGERQTWEPERFETSETADWDALLREVAEPVDYVFVDTHAGLLGPTRVVLKACSHAVGVLRADPSAQRSVDQLYAAVQGAPTLLGIAVNMAGRLERQAARYVERFAGGGTLFEAVLPDDVAVLDAAEAGVPVPYLRGGRDAPFQERIEQLARELEDRLAAGPAEAVPTSSFLL